MDKERIRLDVSKKGVVTFTKTAVVAAVRLLEQRPHVVFKCTSRELIDWANKAMWAGVKEGKYLLGIAWNTPKFNETTINFEIKYGKINMRPIADELPQLMADLIAKTNMVTIEEVSAKDGEKDKFE